MITFSNWYTKLSGIMNALLVTRSPDTAVDTDTGFHDLLQLTTNARSLGRRVFFIGNGASASIASHIAADMCKNGHVKTEVFTDLALVTALVNDLGVERMFSEPLKQQAQKGDILVAISSSGESVNILNAVKQAKPMGMTVVTFSGMKEANSLRASGDLNFYIPAPSYGFAESGHAALLHYWVDAVLDAQTESGASQQ